VLAGHDAIMSGLRSSGLLIFLLVEIEGDETGLLPRINNHELDLVLLSKAPLCGMVAFFAARGAGDNIL
jgi:hypothetical protein